MKLKRLAALGLTLALTLSLAVLPAHALEFSDVPEDFWGYKYIKTMSDKGYAKGYDDGTFKPNGSMTAVEALLFCARATGVDSPTQAKVAANWAATMRDVLPSSMAEWAGPELAVAIEAGVLSLDELQALSTAGALLRTITRENLCMYLVRAMQLEPLAKNLTTYSLSYKDTNEISTSLRPYIFVLTTYGVVEGKENGNFDPKGPVTRAEMTTMLCRALDFAASAHIVTELSEYTDYDWAAGTITAVTPAGGGATILTLSGELTGSTQSYTVPTGARIYENNMSTSASALKSGQYVRLNMNEKGIIQEARLCGTLSSYGGSLVSLEGSRFVVSVNGVSRAMTMDRFTNVGVNQELGDRSIIDEDAGYTTALCYVDGMGHLAGVRFTGGTQLTSGIIESVTPAADGTIDLGITAFNGVIYHYTVPAGAAVTVNGVQAALTAAYKGTFAQLRVMADTSEAQSVAVDSMSTYVQGPIKSKGTIGSSPSFTISDIFSGKDVTCTLSPNAPITYAGEPQTQDQIQTGWYATAKLTYNMVNNSVISQLDAFPGLVTVEGTLTSITYGSTTTFQVTKEDGSIMTYALNLLDLPILNRSGKEATIDQFRTGDQVVVSIRYNNLISIDATPQTANLKAVIDKVTQERTGVIIAVTLSDGAPAEYALSDGISISLNGAPSNIYALKPGYSVALVTSNNEVISVEATATATTSGSEVVGKVLVVDPIKQVLTVQAADSQGRDTLIKVDVRTAAKMQLDGTTLSVTERNFTDAQIRAFGSYNENDVSTFVATIVIKL